MSLAPFVLCSAVGFTGPVHHRPTTGSGAVMMAKSKSVPFLEAPELLVDSDLAGNQQFDPVGFTKAGPKALTYLREAELKHGRICMLAFAGWIAVDIGIRFPGAKYAGLSALTAHDAMVRANCWGTVPALRCTFALTREHGGCCAPGEDREHAFPPAHRRWPRDYERPRPL